MLLILAGCNNISLKDYQESKITELETYVETKSIDGNYKLGWIEIFKAIENLNPAVGDIITATVTFKNLSSNTFKHNVKCYSSVYNRSNMSDKEKYLTKVINLNLVLKQSNLSK